MMGFWDYVFNWLFIMLALCVVGILVSIALMPWLPNSITTLAGIAMSSFCGGILFGLGMLGAKAMS